MLGYDGTELAALPTDVTSSFAGVGNPHAVGRLLAGATVVDIGCGAGTDLLLAARSVGPDGRAIGVDMTEAMRQRAMKGAAACGLGHDGRQGPDTAAARARRSPRFSSSIVTSSSATAIAPA
jgi:arsenite methyltransferase